jgi:hypothetical protein
VGLDACFGALPNRAWAAGSWLAAALVAAPLCSAVPALAAAPLRPSTKVAAWLVLALAVVALLGNETSPRLGRVPDPLQMANLSLRSLGAALLLCAAGLLASVATISRKAT